MRKLTGLLFAGGLGFMLLAIASALDFGAPPMLVGQAVQAAAAQETGAANMVTSVVLGYRGIDTLGELSILFAAAAAAGLMLGRRHTSAGTLREGGFILKHGGAMLFPLLMVIGFYIIFHGHLTPGGGFQGGVILAAAFFLPLLARPGATLHHGMLSVIEGFAGASFILIGLAALFLIPTWVGLVYFMAKRSREGYFVDITPEGLLVGTPVDRFFLKKDQISRVKPSILFPLLPSISIYSGRRRIVMRKLLRRNGAQDQMPLSAWLIAKAPKHTEIRENMLNLKKSLEDLIGQRSI
jgi:multicomponent Na+:H+ antiporter subunit B